LRFGVIVLPGSNCDVDCYHVVKEVLKEPVDYVWHQEDNLDRYDCIMIPGGFSYGDYLRVGAIAKFSPAVRAVEEFAARGKPVLGICNGFQILLEMGLLPGAMLHNESLEFRCEFVHLRVENNQTPFTKKYRKGQVIRVPIAHGEGNYYADEDTLARLEEGRQVVFRYSDPEGRLSPDSNPNGSVHHIAGICNEAGNILGMMPHPERCAEEILGSTDGRLVFESLRSWWEENGGVAGG